VKIEEGDVVKDVGVWYRSVDVATGKTWCESSDLDEVEDRSVSRNVHYERSVIKQISMPWERFTRSA
jgi:hypothetical protein